MTGIWPSVGKQSQRVGWHRCCLVLGLKTVLGLYFPNVLANKSVFWVYGWNECHSEDLVGEEIPAGKAHRSGQSGAVMGFSLELEGCGHRKPEIWAREALGIWSRRRLRGEAGLV